MLRAPAPAALAALLALPGAAAAQAPAAPPPPPLPESAPPSGAVDPHLEPQVTIRRGPGRTVTEFRRQGQLYMVRIQRAGAPPYYLLDQDGDGSLESARWALPPGFLVPHWSLLRW